MSALNKLIKRNCMIYFKDRSAIFFSLLSMLMVILVMIVFLGDMNVKSIVGVINEYGGERLDPAADKANATELILQWTIAGIVIVNSAMVAMTLIGNMIDDKVKGKLTSFYAAPVSRSVITMGYILASMIASFVMSIVTVVVAEGYMAVNGYDILTAVQALKVLGIIALSTFTSSSIMFLLAVLVNTESAWSSLGTVVGTLVGFLGGIYLPVGSLPTSVVSVMKGLPILHETAMMRSVLMQSVTEKCFAGMSPDVAEMFNEELGVTLTMFGKTTTPLLQVLFMIGYGIIAFVVATVIVTKKGVRDR